MPGLYQIMHCLQALTLCAVLFWQRIPAQEVNFQTAKDITWSSINFKTIVEWSPKPTNYTYTVEIRDQFSDWKKKCIYTKKTECDVTDVVQNVNYKYDVRIISEIYTQDIIAEEFPYADGPSFSPYEETIIGKPTIESFDFNKEHTKLTVIVKNPLTPYRFPNNTFKSTLDIFKGDFINTVYYRKAGSTGKKEAVSSTNEIVINTEKGESYCFFVRGTVESRKVNRYSQDSNEKCTSSGSNALSGLATSTGFVYLCNLILLLWLL
ncbi:tissue factor isoform X2 [Pseudophryne corroboree]|uniref:tissue factor isoform X2 n=1 Tax=Pseudophryne corroboree TaxID=495146 RepID=UPI003081845F